jgi:hypothetical protein
MDFFVMEKEETEIKKVTPQFVLCDVSISHLNDFFPIFSHHRRFRR